MSISSLCVAVWHSCGDFEDSTIYSYVVMQLLMGCHVFFFHIRCVLSFHFSIFCVVLLSIFIYVVMFCYFVPYMCAAESVNK